MTALKIGDSFSQGDCFVPRSDGPLRHCEGSVANRSNLQLIEKLPKIKAVNVLCGLLKLIFQILRIFVQLEKNSNHIVCSALPTDVFRYRGRSAPVYGQGKRNRTVLQSGEKLWYAHGHAPGYGRLL